jgi:hypothetical protein
MCTPSCRCVREAADVAGKEDAEHRAVRAVGVIVACLAAPGNPELRAGAESKGTVGAAHEPDVQAGASIRKSVGVATLGRRTEP